MCEKRLNEIQDNTKLNVNFKPNNDITNNISNKINDSDSDSM